MIFSKSDNTGFSETLFVEDHRRAVRTEIAGIISDNERMGVIRISNGHHVNLRLVFKVTVALRTESLVSDGV